MEKSWKEGKPHRKVRVEFGDGAHRYRHAGPQEAQAHPSSSLPRAPGQGCHSSQPLDQRSNLSSHSFLSRRRRMDDIGFLYEVRRGPEKRLHLSYTSSSGKDAPCLPPCPFAARGSLRPAGPVNIKSAWGIPPSVMGSIQTGLLGF